MTRLMRGGASLHYAANVSRRPMVERRRGVPLPDDIRVQAEELFGEDFSDVRVIVSDAAPKLGAIAFTTGSEIHVAPGVYRPGTSETRALLGHELMHVVQQRRGTARNDYGYGVQVLRDEGLEREADRMGKALQCMFSSKEHAIMTDPFNFLVSKLVGSWPKNEKPKPDPVIKQLNLAQADKAREKNSQFWAQMDEAYQQQLRDSFAPYCLRYDWQFDDYEVPRLKDAVSIEFDEKTGDGMLVGPVKEAAHRGTAYRRYYQITYNGKAWTVDPPSVLIFLYATDTEKSNAIMYQSKFVLDDSIGKLGGKWGKFVSVEQKKSSKGKNASMKGEVLTSYPLMWKELQIEQLTAQLVYSELVIGSIELSSKQKLEPKPEQQEKKQFMPALVKKHKHVASNGMGHTTGSQPPQEVPPPDDEKRRTNVKLPIILSKNSRNQSSYK